MSEFVVGAPTRPVYRRTDPGRARGASPRSEADSPGAGRAGLERSLGILLGAVFVALLATAVFLFAPSVFRLTHFEISGAETLSREEIIEASLVREGTYLFAIDPERVAASLRACPRIAEARVERLFPNGLRIGIKERRVVALVLAEVEGRVQLVELDAEGVAFASSSPAPAGKEGARNGALVADGIPLVSGLRFDGFRPGTRLPTGLLPLFSSLAEIEAKAPALLSAFSEIRVVKPRYGELELLLYPLHHRIPVRVAASLNEATLRSIILVLDVLSSRGIAESVEEIDFRTGTIVYRTKEGQSG